MANHYDVIIIGAGPAGATAAAALCSSDLSVMILERSRFPRFVIGESLLPQCMDVLQEVGLLEAVEAAGFQRKTGAIFRQREDVAVFDFGEQYGEGWSYAYQVERNRFDDLLVREVAERGVDVRFEHEVVSADVSAENPVLVVQTPDGGQTSFACRFLIDASGFGRVLPRLLDLERPAKFPPRHAVFSHVQGDIRQGQDEIDRILIAIHPGDPGIWYWAIPFPGSKTSIGVVGDLSIQDRSPSDPKLQLQALIDEEPNMRRRVGKADYLFPPRSVTSYACSTTRLFGDRFVIVGNAGEFLDPIFSSGVTVALRSGLSAAQLVARQLAGDEVDWQTAYVDELQAGIDVFRSLVETWYTGTLQKIIFHKQNKLDVVEKLCALFAGYVWDSSNPFVTRTARRLDLLAEICAPIPRQ